MFGFYFFFKHRKTAFGLNLKEERVGWLWPWAGNSGERDFHLQWSCADFSPSCESWVFQIESTVSREPGALQQPEQRPLLPCVWELSVGG